MRRESVIIVLGIIHIIILSLFGLLFYRWKHTPPETQPTTIHIPAEGEILQ